MNELTHLDLFSGIGGFALAAQRAGFRTVGFCECEPYAQAVIAQHWGAVLADGAGRDGKPDGEKPRGTKLFGMGGDPSIHPDVTTLDATGYRGVTMLTGGFPCQPFSVAGKQRGAADNRHLWPHMLRVIKECRPAWVVGENVPGIINMELDNCISDLEAIGYAVQAFTVPACAVDAKHRRDRLWIVGWDAKREHGKGCGQKPKVSQGPDAVPSRIGQDVADPAGGRRQGQGQYGKRGGIEANGEGEADYAFAISQPAIWRAEPAVGRVADGIPNRSHRLKGLGNAIVPQVAEPFFHWIAQIERGEIA